MRLRTKIKFAATIIAVVSTVGMSLVGYLGAREVLKLSLQERVQALATTVARGIDPTALGVINDAGSVATPQYEQLERIVQGVNASNQGGEFPIRFVYLLTPTTRGSTSGWDVAVDSDARTSKDWAPPGTPYNPLRTQSDTLRIGSSQPSFMYVTDEWGKWLSGFAPIALSDGKIVGLAGADIPYEDILARNDFFFSIAVGLSLLFSLAVYLAMNLTIDQLMISITKIRLFLRSIGEGEFDKRIELAATGEVATVCAELNDMARKLGERTRLVSENKVLTTNVNRQQGQLEAIKQIDEQLNQIQDIDILMERILGEARKLLVCDAGSVMLREGDYLLLKYVQNETLSKRMSDGQRLAVKSVRIPVNGGSIAGYAALSGESIVIDDAYAIPPDRPFHFNSSIDRDFGYRTRAVLAVPLRTSVGKIVGVLQLLNPLDGSGAPRTGFSQSDIDAIQHFASAATMALERTGLTRSLVDRMTKMAELRDPSETGAHINRVAAYSVILYQGWAKRHRLDHATIESQRDILRIAARLHDVGKVGIPDAILKKPGRLTAEEYTAMQAHTTIGAALFAGRDSVLDLASMEVALHHHERWDGEGYPGSRAGASMGAWEEGEAPPPMKGESIPLFARIVAVADVFDALSCKRQYKEAWPERRVLTEMKVNAGRQFDPELIEILMESLDEIRDAAARYDAGVDVGAVEPSSHAQN